MLATFGIIFVAELPDKTALAALVLATRYRARDVIVGAWLAFLVQTVVAIAAGGLLQLLPERPVHLAAGVGFLVFAVLAFRRNELEEIVEEAQEVTQQQRTHRAPWLASFLVVFAAEWGDLTQLATVALAARTGEVLSVALGAVAALWTVTLLAAGVGGQVGRFLSPVMLNRVSGALFAVVGGAVIMLAIA
jgi:putative Ca2+/H+ antiporter (TMEM165/GDT1 family)